jgi:hypothetical protein
LQKGTELVVAVEGKAVAIGDKYKEEIEQEFVVGKSAEKPITEEPMLDVGKTSPDSSKSLRDKRLFFDHGSSFRSGG